MVLESRGGITERRGQTVQACQPPAKRFYKMSASKPPKFPIYSVFFEAEIESADLEKFDRWDLKVLHSELILRIANCRKKGGVSSTGLNHWTNYVSGFLRDEKAEEMKAIYKAQQKGLAKTLRRVRSHRSTVVSLKKEVARLREQLQA